MKCPNWPEWAMPGVSATSPEGFCFHCSKVRGEWVECEALGADTELLRRGDVAAGVREGLADETVDMPPLDHPAYSSLHMRQVVPLRPLSRASQMSGWYTEKQAERLKGLVDRQMAKVEDAVAGLGKIVPDAGINSHLGVLQLEELRDLAAQLKDIVDRRTVK